MASAGPAVETLNIYPATGAADLENLVEWPPKLRPVPVKPLFLDTAWNYIEYPGRSGRAVNERAGEKGAEKGGDDGKTAKKGWFGFGR